MIDEEKYNCSSEYSENNCRFCRKQHIVDVCPVFDKFCKKSPTKTKPYYFSGSPVNSSGNKSYVYHRDNISELINNYINFENNNFDNKFSDQWYNNYNNCTSDMDRLNDSFTQETSHKELADSYVELADSYIQEKNYAKAEKFLNKAKQLSPAKKIDETLAKLGTLKKSPRHKKGKSLFNGPSDFDQAEEFTDAAKQCMREKNYKKAEQYLLKARRLNSTKEINSLLTKLTILINQEQEEKTKMINKDESDRCVDRAEDCLKKRDFNQAKKFLLKAKRLFPSSSVDEYLSKLERIMSEENERKMKSYEEAEKFIKLAESCISNKEYERAKAFLLQSKKIYPNEQVEKLLTKIIELTKTEKKKSEAYFVRLDINKEQAERCLELAKECFYEKNFEKAQKYLQKAKSIIDQKEPLMNEINEMLAKILKEKQKAPEVAENKEQKHYSEAQLNLIKRVLSCKNYDYYGILQIEENASEEDVKKGFRNQARLVHPDKNFAPGANDAIKMVKRAYEILISKIENAKKKEEASRKQQQQQNFSKESFQEKNSAPCYSNDDVNIIKRILRCDPDDFYSILNVEKSATEEDVKRSYKVLVLQVHPNKNFAPGAESALKMVNRAYEMMMEQYETNKKPSETEKKNPETPPNEESNGFYQQNNYNFNYFHFDFKNKKDDDPDPSYGTNNLEPFDKTLKFALILAVTLLAGGYILYRIRSSNDIKSNLPQEKDFTENPPDIMSALNSQAEYIDFLKRVSYQAYELVYTFVSKSHEIISSVEWQRHFQNTLFYIKLTANGLRDFYHDYVKDFLSDTCSVMSKIIIETYSYLREVRLRENITPFVEFFYENTQNMLVLIKQTISETFSKSNAPPETSSTWTSAISGYFSAESLNSNSQNIWGLVKSVPSYFWPQPETSASSWGDFFYQSSRNFLGYLGGATFGAWNYLSGATSGAWNYLGGATSGAWNYLGGAWGLFKSVPSFLPSPSSVYNFLNSNFGYFTSGAAGCWCKIRDFSVAYVPWDMFNQFWNNYCSWNVFASFFKSGTGAAYKSVTYVSEVVVKYFKGPD